RMFFQRVVCLNQNKRSGCLKTYTSLDTDDGIAHMDITTNTIRLCQVLQTLDNLNGTDLLTVQTYRFSLDKIYGYCLRLGRTYRCRPCGFGKVLMGSKRLRTTNRC